MTSFARLSPFAVDSQSAAKGDIVIGRGVAVAVVGCAVARALIWAGTQSDLVEPLATVTLGQRPFAVAGDDRAGRALIVDDLDNTISVLDTRRDHLVRTLHVRVRGLREGLQAIAVDARIGKAYVVGSGLAVGSVRNAFASDLIIRVCFT